jgi:hypothetical protein
VRRAAARAPAVAAGRAVEAAACALVARTAEWRVEVRVGCAVARTPSVGCFLRMLVV